MTTARRTTENLADALRYVARVLDTDTLGTHQYDSVRQKETEIKEILDWVSEQRAAGETPTREGYLTDPRTQGALKAQMDELYRRLSELNEPFLAAKHDLTMRFAREISGEESLEADQVAPEVLHEALNKTNQALLHYDFSFTSGHRDAIHYAAYAYLQDMDPADASTNWDALRPQLDKLQGQIDKVEEQIYERSAYGTPNLVALRQSTNDDLTKLLAVEGLVSFEEIALAFELETKNLPSSSVVRKHLAPDWKWASAVAAAGLKAPQRPVS